MNLKELIRDVERLNKAEQSERIFYRLQGIKQTVEAVDNIKTLYFLEQEIDWQKLKKLLGLK